MKGSKLQWAFNRKEAALARKITRVKIVSRKREVEKVSGNNEGKSMAEMKSFMKNHKAGKKLNTKFAYISMKIAHERNDKITTVFFFLILDYSIIKYVSLIIFGINSNSFTFLTYSNQLFWKFLIINIHNTTNFIIIIPVHLSINYLPRQFVMRIYLK